MNHRAKLVQFKAADRVPSSRLREASPAYRAAADCFDIVCDLGCSGDIADAIWARVEREADQHAQRQVEGRAE